MLDEAKTNGHAEPTRAWEARIEQRLAEFAASGEQRVLALREAMGEFVDTELAPRDEEIATLKKRVADLEHKFERKTAVDQQVHEIATRLEERLAQRDGGKNGITDGNFLQCMGMVFAQERQSARNEFKAADEEMQRALEAKLAALEERLKAVPGKLPVAKIWRSESVVYQGEFVSYEGQTWQACADTAQPPAALIGSAWHAPAAMAVMV